MRLPKQIHKPRKYIHSAFTFSMSASAAHAGVMRHLAEGGARRVVRLAAAARHFLAPANQSTRPGSGVEVCV